MTRLDDIIPGTIVDGLDSQGPVTIVGTKWYGTSVLEVTFKDVAGRADLALLYRDDESRLSVRWMRWQPRQ